MNRETFDSLNRRLQARLKQLRAGLTGDRLAYAEGYREYLLETVHAATAHPRLWAVRGGGLQR